MNLNKIIILILSSVFLVASIIIREFLMISSILFLIGIVGTLYIIKGI